MDMIRVGEECHTIVATEQQHVVYATQTLPGYKGTGHKSTLVSGVWERFTSF